MIDFPIDFIAFECEKFGLIIDETTKTQMKTYCELLISWNQKTNLTTIVEPNEIAEKHFLDSLLLLKHLNIPKGASLIDVGTGAGFPGMMLKLVRPDLNITLLDSLNKRLIFLSEVCSALNIDISLIHSRAEDAGLHPDFREKFEFATSRAVSSLPALSEYCLPLVKKGGEMIALKGPAPTAELISSANALKMLGGETSKVIEYSLPRGDGRSIIIIKKISQTDSKYPRKGVKISKKPL